MIVRIATHQVISEVVDDEAIIINSLTGAYYSLDPVGSAVWTALLPGARSSDALERLVVDGFAVDAEIARVDVQALLDQLIEEGLIEEGLIEPTDNPPLAESVPTPPTIRTYATPMLSKYTDMEELLLLDPIHEVDPQGWPVARDDA
jgi:hypothetical protein